MLTIAIPTYLFKDKNNIAAKILFFTCSGFAGGLLGGILLKAFYQSTVLPKAILGLGIGVALVLSKE